MLVARVRSLMSRGRISLHLRRRTSTRVSMGALAANLCILFSLATPLAASADNNVTVFAGGQTDYATYGFLGATIALPGSVSGEGVAVRASAFSGTYAYTGGTGSVNAHFTGAEVDAVYQLTQTTLWSNFSAGVRYVDTNLAPFDQYNRRHGQQAEFAASLDGGKIAGPWRADWYGSYGASLDDYAARLSFTHRVTTDLRVGAEASFEGDPTYALHRFGPYVGIRMGGRSEMQFSGGVAGQSGRSSGAYVRASLYRSF